MGRFEALFYFVGCACLRYISSSLPSSSIIDHHCHHQSHRLLYRHVLPYERVCSWIRERRGVRDFLCLHTLLLLKREEIGEAGGGGQERVR